MPIHRHKKSAIQYWNNKNTCIELRSASKHILFTNKGAPKKTDEKTYTVVSWKQQKYQLFPPEKLNYRTKFSENNKQIGQ